MIRLWTLGSIKDKIVPTQEAINKFKRLLQTPDLQDIVWGPDVSVTCVPSTEADIVLYTPPAYTGVISEEMLESAINENILYFNPDANTASTLTTKLIWIMKESRPDIQHFVIPEEIAVSNVVASHIFGIPIYLSKQLDSGEWILDYYLNVKQAFLPKYPVPTTHLIFGITDKDKVVLGAI